MDIDTTSNCKLPQLHPSRASVAFNKSTSPALPLLSLNEETPNFDRSFEFSSTSSTGTGTHNSKPSISLYELEPDGSKMDVEFSAAFSPESLTRESASSSYPSDEGGLWYGLPQLWQDSACIPFQEDRIAGFRMGINTCLSASDINLSRPKYVVGFFGVNTRGGIETNSALETTDEAFWVKSTTRRPAPGTEWDFESRDTCVARAKEREGFSWGGRGEGGQNGGQNGENQRDLTEREKTAVERLKGILAHLAI